MGLDEVVDGGYYREKIKSKVGTGDTAKNADMENFWQAKVNPDGSVSMRLLDNHDRPMGYKETAEPGEIGTRFEHMPGFKPRENVAKAEEADRIASRAERHLEKEEFLSAEFEFSKAVKIDDNNVRANYGLGQAYLGQGETEKARSTFKKLVDIDEVTDPRHKHIFNNLGIDLRKQGMFAEAVRHYKRALDLSQQDEHLWFNLGRALFEGGMYRQAAPVFKKALDLKPEFEEAKAFMHAALKKCTR